MAHRISSVDGLRGVAIGLVLLRHYIPPVFPNAGIIGVDLFFVISGFVITGTMFSEHSKFGRISLRDFFVRRALRLLPALYFMLAIYIAVVAATKGAMGTDLGGAVQGALMSVLYVFNFGASAGVTPEELGPLWTLSVEEQFYILWPLVLVALMFRKASGRGIVIGLGSAILLFWLVRPTTWMLLGNSIYNLPTTWADALILGAMMAVAKRHGIVPTFMRHIPTLRILQGMAWVVVVGAIFLPELKSSFAGYAFLLPLLAVSMGVIVWSAAEAPDMRTSKLWAWKPIVWLGGISYSLYLWNYLVREWTMAAISPNPWIALVVGVPASFLLAWVSLRFVETPTLKLKHRFTRSAALSPSPQPVDS